MSQSIVDHILNPYSRALEPTGPPRDLGSAGGLSGARLIRYPSGRGELVIRGWPVPGPSRAHLERIHHWLARATSLEFIAAPIPDRSGATIQEHHGRLWEVAQWLPGMPDLSQPPTPKHIQNAFQGLGALHQRLAIDLTLGVSPGLVERLDSIRRLAGGGFGELEQAIKRSPYDRDREADLARRWVDLARRALADLARTLEPVATREIPLQPALRDTRAAHFLFVVDDLTGLVDYGAMGIESVAADLGRLLGDWLEDDLEYRRLALESYERVRPLPPAESILIPAFIAGTSFLIGERWIRWHFLERRQFGDGSAVANGIARSIAFLERRLSTP